MSTVSLSPEPDLAWAPRPPPRPQPGSRRRTVSTSFEQSGGCVARRRLALLEGRRVASCADKLGSALAVEEESEEAAEARPRSLAERVPCLGILLVLLGVTVFQAGSVLAKKMTLHPVMMLLTRDLIMITWTTPLTIAGGDNPFPPGKWHLVVVRGTLAGCQLMSHFYAVRHLPLSDVMMLASIKPVSGTLLARLFLKEAVGVFEVLNLVLVVTGLCLVVQPSFVFGDTGQQYDQHMMLTALAVVVANALGGGIGVIIRYLRAMHWAALAVTTRIFTVAELSVAAAVLGLYCVPACGLDRWGIVLVAVAGSLTQMLFIFGLKVEEAHVVTLTDNAASIIVSFTFQLVFFQDYPNTLKIIGLCVVILSILLLGGHKIIKHRKDNAKI